jgi:ABC-2 type transport system permease protein
MKAVVALIHREYLEHRGAFLYGPAVILAVMTLFLLTAISLNRFRMPFEVGVPSLLKFFEIGFLGLAALWFVYLLVTLFFYYADAFSADRRNNAMLFWKSLPLTDFKVLASKMLAGLTIFPALIFGALLLSLLVLYLATGLASVVMPRLVAPSIIDVLVASWEIILFAAVYVILALLWYAPFFAWVGALSTVVRRWSIPLAFLIPGLLGLMENLVHDGGPKAGYFLNYLRSRLSFLPHTPDMERAFLSDNSVDAGRMLSALWTSIDWSQMVGGLLVATLLVYLASEYRRRLIIA